MEWATPRIFSLRKESKGQTRRSLEHVLQFYTETKISTAIPQQVIPVGNSSLVSLMWTVALFKAITRLCSQCGFIAELLKLWNFSQASLCSNCSSWNIHCNDHLSLKFTSTVHMWIISHPLNHWQIWWLSACLCMGTLCQCFDLRWQDF